MGQQAPKPALIMIAVAFALSCFGFTLFVWKSFGGPTPFEAHGYQFRILFGSEASSLTPNADVRISGVNIGKVISVKRRGLGAEALLQVERPYAPVHTDTRAIVRFKSLLGEAFVELTPGSKDAPELAENDTLPKDNIGDVQQVDKVLGAFDEPTRAAFKKFLQGTAKALDKRGSDVNAALGHLAPTAENASELIVILDKQRDDVQSLISDSSIALDTIADRQAEVRSVITAGNQVFEATASRNRELTEVVRALPDFLSLTRDALVDINAAALEAKPTLDALRPVIPLVGPALDEAIKLAPSLRKTFDALNETVPSLKRGLPALNRVLKAARPALKVLYVAGRELIPISQFLDAYKRDLLASVAKVGAATNYQAPNSDQTGQRALRVVIPINETTPTNAEQRLASQRHNSYTEPDALDKFPNLEAYDCRNTSNPQTIPILGSGVPDCINQGPWEFRQVSRSFPHVTIDEP